MQSSLARVLVAVDGSTNAHKAFESALDLAKKLRSNVYVLRVIEMPSTLGVKKELMLDLKMQFEIEARRLLAEYFYLAQSKYGIEVETIFRSGYPPRVILDVAKEKDADLIVVGSRGLSGVKEAFLGSVSHSIARESKIPVLVVK